MNPAPDLPDYVEQTLSLLVSAAKASLGEDLKSIVLFGSGAEGRLRPSSDLNLLFVLRRFDKERIDSFREPLRMAQAAQRATGMFVLESELPDAVEAFAVKFDDIARRHRVLFGEDPVSGLMPSVGARKRLLRQVLLNLSLRLRERYASHSLREENLALVVSDSMGPLRSAAATLLELEGRTSPSPREAFHAVAAESIPDAAAMLELVSQARKTMSLPSGQAGALCFQLMTVVEAMRKRTAALR